MAFLGCTFLSAVVFARVPGQVKEVDMGELTIKSSLSPIAISVSSPDALTEALLRRAFASHGAYTLRTGSGAVPGDFRFTCIPAEENVVGLAIASGEPMQVQFEAQVTGRTPSDAVLRAADLAVEETLGIPGIFAGRIAFVGRREGSTDVYSGGLFFQDVLQLTNHRAHCVGPEFSPDGKIIVYTSYFPSGFPDIYTIDVESRIRRPFVSYAGTNVGATFNPKGDHVALVLSATGNADVYLCDATGRNPQRVVRTPNGVEADPAWSPDGRRIAFTSDRLGSPQLFEVSAAGGALRRIPTNISNWNAEPAWNPRNLNQIAFTIRQGRFFKIALFDFSNGVSRVLTRPVGDASEPVWTRDGRHLIYTEGMAGKRRLTLLDTVTGQTTPLHDAEVISAYQPDYVYTPR